MTFFAALTCWLTADSPQYGVQEWLLNLCTHCQDATALNVPDSQVQQAHMLYCVTSDVIVASKPCSVLHSVYSAVC